jgi:hypothetical protein
MNIRRNEANRPMNIIINHLKLHFGPILAKGRALGHRSRIGGLGGLERRLEKTKQHTIEA